MAALSWSAACSDAASLATAVELARLAMLSIAAPASRLGTVRTALRFMAGQSRGRRHPTLKIFAKSQRRHVPTADGAFLSQLWRLVESRTERPRQVRNWFADSQPPEETSREETRVHRLCGDSRAHRTGIGAGRFGRRRRRPDRRRRGPPPSP